MAFDGEPIAKHSFDAAQLMREHPPRLRHPNKQAVFRIACPAGADVARTVTYTRWWAMSLPERLDASKPTEVEARPDVYDYEPAEQSAPAVEWHVNFADPQLFAAYGSRLFAQDEMQAAEHPVLGSLVEALGAVGERAVTVDGRIPTPVLVQGAERRVRIATDANMAEGRPEGLYGNRFGDASVAAIERATTPIRPPTITNLIAMAAPTGGAGAYSYDEIESILTTAYTGFRAAWLQSLAAGGDHARTLIHTGFWGCGAFGGNRVLMSLAQVLAAHLAGVDRLVFHTFNAAGLQSLAEAQEKYRQLIEGPKGAGKGKSLVSRLLSPQRQGDSTLPLRELIWRIEAMAFQWGASDGN